MSGAEMPGEGASGAEPAPAAPAAPAPAPAAPAAPAAWAAAPSSGGAAGLYGGRRGADLTITDALTAGYRFLLNPDFSVPILVIGVIIQVIVAAIFAPFIVGLVVRGSTDPSTIDVPGMLGSLVAGAVAAIVAAVVGGIILNLYGQVWATMAAAGDPPKMAAAFTRVGERWVNILGAGLIVGVIELGALIVLGIIAAILGAIGALLFIVGLLVIAYVAIRLSMAGWLAADGAAAMDAVKGSWELTNRNLMTIIYWSVAIGVVVFVITLVAGIILGLIPVIGSALTQTLGTAFGFGAGVTLYHRIKDA